MDPYIGEIRLFAGNYAPKGWAICDGKMLRVNENQALFSIIGNQYGGDGKSTFALPDLRGKVAMHKGAGPGLTPRPLASTGGSETVTLLTGQIPPHTHQAKCQTSSNSQSPVGNVWGPGPARPTIRQIYANVVDTVLNPGSLGPAGNSQPHNNMQPYLGLNFIIALEGIFPPKP
jgi:microcystin-dependent protein